MSKKTLSLFLIGTMFFFCSCVDDNYDLNKSISTDVSIKGNKLALPLGNLKPFELGTWFDGLDIIETLEDGVYAFVHSDTIAPIERTPNEVLINIKPQHITSQIDVSKKIPSIPTIPNIPGIEDIMLKDFPNPIDIAFDEKNEFSFTSPISMQYIRVDSVELKEELHIDINIKVDGLESLTESGVNMNLNLILPPFLNSVYSYDPNVSTQGSQVIIRKAYPVKSTEGLSIELISKELNFVDKEGSGLHPENGNLAYDGEIRAEGNIQIEWTKNDLLNNIKNLKKIGFNVDCLFTPVNIQTINGTFYEKFDTLRQTFKVDLGEQLNSLKESENHITLSDPQLTVFLNNSISMPINVSLDVMGKDVNGNIIDSEEISTIVPIKAAKYDNLTGIIVPDTSKLFVTDEYVEVADDYTNVVIPNLGRLLESIPDSINVAIHPDIDKSIPHHIDIYQILDISASYDIMIPFKFDKLYIIYSDTIPANLGDTFEGLGDAELKLRMNIENTIPVGLKLNISALDKNNKPINAIKIDPIEIKQGNGESIASSKSEKNAVAITLQNKDESLKELDKLKLEIEIQTEDATMGLKGAQGIRISDVVIELSADIEITDEKDVED